MFCALDFWSAGIPLVAIHADKVRGSLVVGCRIFFFRVANAPARLQIEVAPFVLWMLANLLTTAAVIYYFYKRGEDSY